jgi:hypothetical protein
MRSDFPDILLISFGNSDEKAFLAIFPSPHRSSGASSKPKAQHFHKSVINLLRIESTIPALVMSERKNYS